MNQSSVLITGSRGSIGSMLWGALSGRFNLYGIDQIGPEDERNFMVDITDCGALENVFRTIEPIHYIVHLAADREVKASWESVLRNNIVGTRNVFECAKQAQLRGTSKIRKIIFASTFHVNGADPALESHSREVDLSRKPISPDDPPRPDGYYATSKLFGEALARQFYEMEPHLPTICLRIGAYLPASDVPPSFDWPWRVWISEHDLVQSIERAMLTDVPFGIYFAVSDNHGNLLDMASAKRELGYQAQDHVVPRIMKATAFPKRLERFIRNRLFRKRT